MAIANQECSTTKGRANADVFFDGQGINGLQQLHAMAHLILAVLGDQLELSADQHVGDYFFEDSFDPHYVVVVFTIELDIKWLGSIIQVLWLSFLSLLGGELTDPIYDLVLSGLRRS